MNEVFLNYLQNQNLIYNFLIIFKLKYVLSLPCRKFWKNNYFLRKYEFTNQRKFWLKVNKYEVWFLLQHNRASNQFWIRKGEKYVARKIGENALI